MISGPNIASSSTSTDDHHQQQISTAAVGGGGDLMITSSSGASSNWFNNNNHRQKDQQRENPVHRQATFCKRRAAEKAKEKQVLDLKEEISILKNEIEVLQKSLSCMYGGGAETMTLNELHSLEKYIEVRLYHIRSAKRHVISQEIQLLKNKDGILKASNKYLQDKIDEQYTVTSMTPAMTFNAQ